MFDENKLKNYLIGFETSKNVTKSKVENKLEDMEQKILRLTNEKRDTLELYAKGNIERATYSKKCMEYDNEMRSVKNERSTLLATIPALHKKNTVDTSLEQYCNALETRFKKCADFNSKRQLLRDYIHQVVLTNGKIKVCGSVPVQLDAYTDPDQPSDAKEIKFSIPAEAISELRK
jgi:hypothetical protein